MEEVNITIGMDAGPADRELAGLQANVRKTGQSVKEAELSIEKALEDEMHKHEEHTGTLQKDTDALNDNADATKRHSSALNDSGQSAESARTRLRNFTEELVRLTGQYRSMTSEEKNSEYGQQIKKRMEELADKAGELRDAMEDVHREIGSHASDTSGFDALAGGINVVTSSIGAATGVAAMFGVEEEKLLDIQTKLQASLAISNALTVIQKNVQKESAMMVGIATLQKKAATIAENIDTAAKGRNVIATKAATVAQRAFNLVAKANPYVLLAMAIVTVVGALAAFAKGSKEAAKAESERQAAMEKIRKEHERFANTVADSASKQIMSYRELQKKWNELGEDMKAKEKFIKDNKTAFNNLGFAVDSVTDAEKILVNNTDAVVNSIMARAKAAAYQELAMEELKRSIERKMNDTQTREGRVRSGMSKEVYQAGVLGKEKMAEIREKYGIRGNLGDAEYRINEAEASWLNTLAEAYQKSQQKKTKALEEESAKRMKFYEDEATKMIEEEKETAKQTGVKPYNKETKEPKVDTEKAAKILEARDRLFQQQMQQDERQAQQALQAANAQEEARVAAIEDEGEREREEMKHQHELAIQQIQKQADEYRKANYEAKKKAYEAANPGKKYSQTEEGAVGWSSVALTDDQAAEINARLRKQYTEYARVVEEYNKKIQENARLSRNELARLFGDYADQKVAIIDEANHKIIELEKTLSDESTDEEREAVKNQVEIIKKQLVGELQELDLKYGKIKPFFSDLFEEEADRSIASINKLMAKYQALVDFLKGNNNVSRESLVSDYGFTDGEIDAAIEKFQKEGVGFVEDLEQGLHDAGEQIKKKFEQFKQGVSQFLSAFTSALSAVKELDEGEDQLSDYILGAAEAIQSLFSMDMGGVVRAFAKIDKAANYIEDNHEWSVKQEEAYQQSIDANTQAINANTETLKKINGIEAVRAADEVVRRLESQLSTILNGIITVSNDTSLGENGKSIAQRYDESRTDWVWIKKIADTYGLDAWDPNAWTPGREGNTPVQRQTGKYTWTALLSNNSPKDLARAFKDMKENGHVFTGELGEWIDKLIQAYEDIEQAEKDLFENLNNMTADEAFSSFLSSLYDLADGSEDVFDDIAANWQKMVNRMVVNNLIGSEMRQELEDWYTQLAQLNRERVEGGISDEEYRNRLEGLKQAYDDLVRSGQDKMQSFVEMGIIKPVEEATEAVKDFEDEIDSLISSLSDTSTIEEWGKSFKENIINQFMQGFLNDEDKSHIKDAMQSIADIMNDTSLTPEAKADLAQPYIEAIEQYVAGGKELAQQLREALGITDKDEEKLATPFENLKDDILDSLTDLENGAEDFKKKMSEAMIKDVIEKMVLGNEVERENADGSWTVFDTFNDWLEDWQQRYSDILNDATLSDEEREARLQALVDEAVAVRESEAESAEKFAEKLKEIEEIEHDTTFKDMSDEWKSTLMDMEADADSFGDKIREMMAEKVMQSMIEARGLQAFLDSQQEAINAIFEGDGSWEEKMEAIQPIIDEMISKYEELAPYAEKIRDAFGITKKQQEAENPFSNLKDNLVDALMDMDSTAKDFGKQIGASLAKEMIAKVVEDKYGERIKTLATALQDAIATGDAGLIDQARYALEALYTEIQNDTQAIRETQRVIEELNDTTFTDLRDSFRSAIMDMTADAKSFAQDITQIVTEKLIDRLVLGEGFDKKLEEIQTQYNAIMSSDKSEAEKAAAVAALTQQVAALGVELQGISQGIMDATGWTQIVERMNSPLSDLRSLFRSTLMDMNADANDFIKSIGDTMTEAFIDKFVLGDAFDEQLEKWQDEYAKIMKSDISEEERARQLRNLRDAIANAKESYADAARGIQELMGTAEYQDQSATLNMSDKATYEQMDQYLGTNMGILMATEQGNQVRVQILATLQQMSGLTSTDNPLLSEMRGLMAIGNEYLLDIKRSNREILTSFGAKLSSIDSKLNRVL